MVLKNVIWFQHINDIGGVESVMYNVVRKYDRDITILYATGSTEQVYRLSQYADVIQFDGQFIECERMFINYGYHMIEGHFKAKETIYLIHADYKYQKLAPVTDPSFRYVAVSKWAADRYFEVSGIRPEVCYNPIIIDDCTRALLIVSATRVSSDKGKMKWRMEHLAERLTQRKIPFVWLVFTNSKETFEHPHIVKLPPELGILPYLKSADFVAQLSDSEACCMTALEALSLGVPMIVTKIPSFYEQGMNETNAIFLDFDMSNTDECIDRMYEEFNFSFTPKEDRWDEMLTDDKKQRRVKPMKKYLCKVTDQFQDAGGIILPEIGRVPHIDEEVIITGEGRANSLVERGFVTILKELEEPKEEVKEPKKKSPRKKKGA